MADHFKEIIPVTELFNSFPRPWCICGAWALDLFLGYKTREHDDVEIFTLRKDQLILHKHLHDWNLYYIKEGEKNLWPTGQYLQPPVHELWANKEPQNFEILLNEIDLDSWIYRRNYSILFPLSKLILKSNSDIPFLNPSIVLLYKSKALRDKDQRDFELVLPYLPTTEKIFLRNSLLLTEPRHLWLSKLSN